MFIRVFWSHTFNFTVYFRKMKPLSRSFNTWSTWICSKHIPPPHNKTFCTTIKTSVNNNLFINVQYLVTTVFLLELCIALQISLSLQICTFSRNAFKYLSYWIFKEVIINLFLHERLPWMFFDRYLYKIQNLLKLQLALTYFF